MGPGKHAQHNFEKPKNASITLRKLFSSLKKYRRLLIVTIVLAIIGSILTVVGPRLMGDMINILSEDFIARFTNPDHAFRMADIAHIGLNLLGFYIIAFVINYISGWIMTSIANNTIRKFRRQISQKINRLPISYFDKHQFGDTLSRITNDIDTISGSLQQSVSQIITSVVLIIGIVVMMFTISWQLTLIALVTIPASLVIVRFMTSRSQKFFKNQQLSIATLNGHIEESYSGQTIIRIFNHEQASLEAFEKSNQHLYENSWKSQFFSDLMRPAMHFVSNLGYVATVIAGGYFAINGRIGIGDIAAFTQYVNQFNQPIAQLAQIVGSLQSVIAASERIFEFLEEPEDIDEHNPEALAILGDKITGQVEFRDVRFSYDGDTEVIKGFSAKIKPGAKVAIVGPTGAGKTTIVNLLMRFYDPTSGSITIDGVNTKQLPRATVRQLFGMVLQDTWLFDGTIAENLRYGKLDATKRELDQVARTAHIDHMIKSLPKSFNTLIDEDSEAVSVGEKQLLTIARAMIADPPMMILDEATSSVDTRTEQLIQQAMDKLTHGRTSFIIAHRLSTIKNADLILVMQEGNIVEQGTHAQLLKANALYADLYNSQFAEG